MPPKYSGVYLDPQPAASSPDLLLKQNNKIGTNIMPQKYHEYLLLYRRIYYSSTNCPQCVCNVFRALQCLHTLCCRFNLNYVNILPMNLHTIIHNDKPTKQIRIETINIENFNLTVRPNAVTRAEGCWSGRWPFKQHFRSPPQRLGNVPEGQASQILHRPGLYSSQTRQKPLLSERQMEGTYCKGL